MSKKKIKRRKQTIGKKKITFVSVVGFFTIVGVLYSIISGAYNLYRDNHPNYSYETNFDWLEMEEAVSVLSSANQVHIFCNPNELSDNTFYDGAALIALYHNLAQQERIITQFSVYAENIEEDLSPLLSYSFSRLMNPVSLSLYNSGWGETGTIQIELLSLTPAYGFEDQDAVDLSIKEDAQISWTFDTLQPGETRDYSLLSEDDFVVEKKGDFDFVVFHMKYILTASESDYYDTLECAIQIFPDRMEILMDGLGDGNVVNYIVWVDTSSPSWSNTYPTYQRIPGNQTVRLPIFIMPAKSCTMTVRVEFETADGKTIQATPLQEAHFIIPYYESDPVTYVDGKLLDWNAIDGTAMIYFPFVNTSKVIPGSEVIP